MKNKFCLLLAFILITGMLTGCGGGSQETGGASGDAVMDTCYYAYNSTPVINLDPSVAFSNEVIVLNNIYETLLRYDPETKEFESVLAEDYEVSEDMLTWTFSLREGVKFHDGADFKAEAVKYSVERTKELAQGASFIWDPVESVNVVDEYTVEFKLSYPAPLNLVAACPYGAFMISPGTKDKDTDWFESGNAAGTGPYMLENYAMGDEVILTKFDGYWKGWDGRHFDKAIIKSIPETSSRRQLIEKGEADITVALPPEDMKALEGAEGVTVRTEKSFINMMALLNTQKPPLDNPKVREALAYAFPYQDAVDYAIGGFATQARGVIPAGLWGHGDNLFQYQKDLDKAKALLNEAGIKEGELKLLLTYMSGDEGEKKCAELYKAELSKIGVELEIRAMPWESQWSLSKSEKVSDRQDILLFYWWPDVATPYSWLKSLFYTEDVILFNLGYYSNKEVDRLIDEGYQASASDLDAAEKIFIQAQEKIMEDNPAIFIYDKQDLWALNSSIKGFEPNPCYPLVVFFYDLYRE